MAISKSAKQNAITNTCAVFVGSNSKGVETATPSESKIDSAESVAVLQKMLQTTDLKKGSKIIIKIFGSLDEVRFLSADPQGFKVDIKGNTMPIRWKDIDSQDLAQSVFVILQDDQEALFHAGCIAAALKNNALYEKVFNQSS